ncbi:hypothetical protein BHM03_00057441 [Ensete ventricosum]|nr:hypothetical protein BHM03_00057441 [Ensete ventricosum]
MSSKPNHCLHISEVTDVILGAEDKITRRGCGRGEEMAAGNGEVVKVAECGCCGMWEECTVEYIGWVKEQFGGVWVCGLCTEAIKDEQARLGVGVEAAMMVHAKFRQVASIDPTVRIALSLLHFFKKMISSCDRILWLGEGLKQKRYERCEV